MKLRILCVVVGFLLLVLSLSAQTAGSSPAVAQVPPLIQFSNVATDVNGKPLTGVVGINFYLYREQQGGSPLWLETQNVQPDNTGHYSVMLGSTTSQGLPTSIFTSGEAQWLGVQVQGQEEQPRALLVSAPYALKAGDAGTIGGLPPSAFVLALPTNASGANASNGTILTPADAGSLVSPKPLPAGKANYIPVWIGTKTAGNSVMYQANGTSIGVGTTSPGATLDVNGNINAGTAYNLGGSAFAFGSSSQLNAFLGFAGNTTMSGGANTASGYQALHYNTSGQGNTASGYQAMYVNSTGSYNTGTGTRAGSTEDGSYLTGQYNTALGYDAFIGTGTLNNATAIGALAEVSESNALVLGCVAGVNSCPAGVNVGIGTTAPGHLLDVAGTTAIDSTGLNNGTNFIDLTFGLNAGEGMSSSRTAGPNQYGIDLYTDFNRRISIEQHGNVGIGTTSPDNLLTVNGSADKPGGGSWGTFSDARLKIVNGGFTDGLSQVMKIQPIHYRYKPDNAMGIRDADEHIGVVAQEVQKIIPEAVTENSKGYLLVNNDPIIWTMLNAIKEQQREIKQQQSLLRAQSATMKSLQAEVRNTRETLRKVKAQLSTPRLRL